MTGFDIIVLAIVGLGAVGGFVRGFVQEVLSLAAWVLAIFAIRYLHTDLSAILYEYVGTPSGAAMLAFVVLLLVPSIALRLIARWAGTSTRESVLGPVDRVLGFGFGTVKGVIIVVMTFSLIVLGYDTIWGEDGRPDWMRDARTYPFVNASSEAMVQLIRERRALLEGEEDDSGEEDVGVGE